MVGSPEELPSRPTLRLTIVGLIVLVLFGVMVLRLWTLQVVNHQKYASQISVNTVRSVQIAAPRGEIVDRKSTLLVSNNVLNEIVLSRAEAAQHPAIIGQVAALVGEQPSQVEAALNNVQYSPYQPVPVMFDAPTTTVQYLMEHQAEFPGVSVDQVTQRTYPQGGELATGVIGYVTAISAQELATHPNQGYNQASQFGQAGVENQYETYLKGTDGTNQLEVDPRGQVVGTLSKSSPVQGDTLVLHLDQGLQNAVAQSLAADMQADMSTADPTTHNYPTADSGAAVVMDAHTGAVLAMVSLPTYDLNEWVGGISDANYKALTSNCQGASTNCALDNYAIQGLYTPGSTFKLATAWTALQAGLIAPNTPYNDTGKFTVDPCHGDPAGCTFQDADTGGLGTINVSQALTASSDSFFYNLGYQFWLGAGKYGKTPIQDTANAIGFGSKTGVDLPGEVSGQIDSQALRQVQHSSNPQAFPNPTYYAGDNIEMAFGQGETVVTPIGEAQAYATFADHGTRYAPQVAAGVVSPEGKLLKQFPPQVIGHQTISESTYNAMVQGFQGAINDPSGTAYQTFQADSHVPEDSFPLAGKTGTADIGRGAEPNAWFVGFGPTNAAASEPEYVVAAVVTHGGYGAQAAAPAVASIFNYLYANPIQPVVWPSAATPPSSTPPTTIPPAGTPPPTTSTTTTPSGA